MYVLVGPSKNASDCMREGGGPHVRDTHAHTTKRPWNVMVLGRDGAGSCFTYEDNIKTISRQYGLHVDVHPWAGLCHHVRARAE